MSDERTDTAPARRILVIANETVAGTALHQAIRFRARHGSAEVLVVVPALGGRMRRSAPAARASAEDRLGRSLDRLRRAGVRVRGQLGDADPLRAIGDALGAFGADEILVATHPQDRSAWLAGDVVARARSRFGVPVLHVVVHRGGDGGGSGPGPGRRRFAAPVTPPTLSAS
jgi:GABA permease